MITRHMQQEGFATPHTQLKKSGFTDSDIRRALRGGELERVNRGAFYTPHDDLDVSHARQVVALARSLPLPYALSDQSALAAWGVPRARCHLDRFHLTLPPGHRPDSQRRGVVLHTPPAEGSLICFPAPWDDVLSVAPAVACCQVAIRCGVPAGLVAADFCLHAGLFSPNDLVAATTSTGLTRNRARADKLAMSADPLCESVGESLARWEMNQLGYFPRSQVEIYDDQGLIGRVDFLLGDTVIEFDGAIKYENSNGREALMREKRREDRLRRRGYNVARVTWTDLNPRSMRRLLAGIQPVAA